MKATDRVIYGNWTAVDQSDKIMFRCDDRKVQWYLKMGLAEVASEDPPILRLLFEPNGQGHRGDPFFLQQRKNRCVVCGTTENLTRHHVLPHCYRKFFPRKLDRFGSYDVFAVCVDDHNRYEELVPQLRREIVREYDAPSGGSGGRADKDTNKAVSAAYALMRYSDRIPEDKQKKLKQKVLDFFNEPDPTWDFLKKIIRENRSPYKSHGQIVVESFSDDYEALGKFTVRWRKHFVHHMKPKFLPEHWEIDRIFIPPRN